MTVEITHEDIANIHPVAAAVLAVLDERDDHANMAFTPREILEINDALRDLYGQAELRDAVRCLLNLGAHLQETGSSTAGQQLLDMLAAQELLDALDAVNDQRHEASSEKVAKASVTFGIFSSGRSTKPRAPRFDEGRPVGTLSLDNLSFRRRL